jgi:capsular polysaccharide biosynthesis protein
VSPDPAKIFGAGLLASLLLAMAAAVAPDLWSGRIVQRWQMERSLDLPILGEVRRRA